MTTKMLALMLAGVIAITMIAAGYLWLSNSDSTVKSYSYSLSVEDKSYIVAVNTNWTSEPKVYLPEFDGSYVSVDFTGPNRETVYFNITIPTDLIWGNISLVWKYYEQNPNRYILSNNGTHNSVYMAFRHTATIEHFEIWGTENAW